MLPGQEKAMKAHAARLESGHDPRLSLVLLFEEGFQVGQGVVFDIQRQEKDRCPICSNKLKKEK
jgi:regulator of replication initiation timing